MSNEEKEHRSYNPFQLFLLSSQQITSYKQNWVIIIFNLYSVVGNKGDTRLGGHQLYDIEPKDKKQLHLHLVRFCLPSSVLIHPASMYDLTLFVSLDWIIFLTNSDVLSIGGRRRNSKKVQILVRKMTRNFRLVQITTSRRKKIKK